MELLLEAIVGLIKSVFIAIRDLFGFLLAGSSATQSQTKYNNQMLSFWERWKLLRRSFTGPSLSGKLQISSRSSAEGILVVGPTGSGKSSVISLTSAITLPNSFIVLDVDGQIYAESAGHNEQRGFEIRRINLSDPSLSEQIDFVRRCRNRSDERRLAENIMYNEFAKSTGGDSKFWEFGAISVLRIAIGLVRLQPIEQQHLSSVRAVVQRFNQLDESIASIADEALYSEFLAFSSAEDKIKNSFITQALLAIDKFGDEGLAHITGDSTLDFESFTSRKSAWYIQVREVDIPYYSAFLTLFFSEFFAFIQRNPPHETVYVLLDEAGQIPIKDLPTILTSIRKYRCSCTLLLQEARQLQAFYGQAGYLTIISGACAHKVIFPGVSVDFARELSEAFGRKGFGAARSADGFISDSREVLSPTDIIQGKKNRALYYYRNKPPYYMRMHPAYKQWRFFFARRKPTPQVEPKPVQVPPLISFTSSIPFDHEA